MKLTADEQRALGFIAALLLVSAAVRLAALPEPVGVPESAGFEVDAHIAATEEAVGEAERRSRPLEEGERLDPNTASAVELDRLPGVGPALAQRIVEARDEERFRTAADLARVPGLGERTVQRLEGYLVLVGGERRSQVLDLNAADPASLTRLSGIGPVLAERIVAFRDSAGPFPAVDSLVAVPGIGPATLARIRDRLRVR